MIKSVLRNLIEDKNIIFNNEVLILNLEYRNCGNDSRICGSLNILDSKFFHFISKWIIDFDFKILILIIGQ